VPARIAPSNFDFELFGRSRRQRTRLYDFNGSVIGCAASPKRRSPKRTSPRSRRPARGLRAFLRYEQAIVVGRTGRPRASVSGRRTAAELPAGAGSRLKLSTFSAYGDFVDFDLGIIPARINGQVEPVNCLFAIIAALAGTQNQRRKGRLPG